MSILCTMYYFYSCNIPGVWSYFWTINLKKDRKKEIGFYSHLCLSEPVRWESRPPPYLQCADSSALSHSLPALPSLPARWGPQFFLWWPGPLQFLKHTFNVVPLFHIAPPLKRDWAPLCHRHTPWQSFPCIFCSRRCHAWRSPHRSVVLPSHRDYCRVPHATLARKQGRRHVVLGCFPERTEQAFFSGGGGVHEELSLTTGQSVLCLAGDVLGIGTVLFPECTESWWEEDLVPKSYSCMEGEEAEKWVTEELGF